MRLSEAIMLGSTIHPQGFGKFRQVGPSGMATCAWGAAHDAVGNHYGYDDDPENWDWVHNPTRVQCPDCGVTRRVQANVIVHLNDDHRWTRERIAEWVATVEPKEPEPRTESEQAALDANNEIAMQGHDRWLERSAGCYEQD
jgi:hypothetical protein